MIECFDFKTNITENHQINAINKINFLFSTENWCKTVPHFQTYSHLQEFEEFNIFVETFKVSCYNYLAKYQNKKNFYSHKIKMWCYHDNINIQKRNAKEFGYESYGRLWHNHEKDGANLSGVYFLRNLNNEPTLFKDFRLLNAKPFSWFIFPSNTYHSPPETKSIEGRYTLAADFYIVKQNDHQSLV